MSTSLTRWLTTREAAAYVGCSHRTFIRYLDDGTLPRHRFGKHLVRIDLRELDSYLESRRETPGSPLGGVPHV